MIERAKGILMERHGIDERAAFEHLRDHARSQSRRVVDVARAVTEGHALLPPQRPVSAAAPGYHCAMRGDPRPGKLIEPGDFKQAF